VNAPAKRLRHKEESAMRLKHLALGLAVATAACAAVATAQAEDGIYVPLFSYRTGPYSGAGAAIFNGMQDYLTMLNERDGGVGGARLIVEECETGYDTKKGVECYDATKGKNPVVVNPYSTGITLQLIPKAAVDRIPVLSMAYGLSASADGNDFPWVFNPPATASSTSMRPTARSRFRSLKRSPRITASRSSSIRCRRSRCRTRLRSGSTSAATAPIGSICRAGAP
jgi:hypothetical protein